jgi:teichuronic acid biosynthesis glycosyltransferase TuaC
VKVLVLTTLYPNSEQQRHGIFVENRVRKLVEKYPDIEVKVLAPVPYFPISSGMAGEYGKYANIPTFEKRFDIEIFHPRYLVIPKIGMNITPYLLYWCALKAAKKIQREGFDFDLIDAHYFYPDGVAANWVAKKLYKPITITARGNDISLLPDYFWPKKLIKNTLAEIDAGIGVCQALVDEMALIQPSQDSLYAFRNGVDLTLFAPSKDREQLRNSLGFNNFTVVSVGHLIERKGHHLIIDALTNLPDVHLKIIGDGPMMSQLKTQIARLGLSERVLLLGAKLQSELPRYYCAADALVLASSREGWANVLLESMACGTPVVATPIWGTPEVVGTEGAGVLTEGRRPADIANAIEKLRDHSPSRGAVRTYAEKFSWDETTTNIFNLFKKIYESYQ